MSYKYTIKKQDQTLSLFQDDEYVDLNIPDIELFCEDFLFHDFVDQNSEEALFRNYLMIFLSKKQEEILPIIENAWHETKQAYPGIIALYSHNMVTAKKDMSLKKENRSRVRTLLNQYIGDEKNEILLPKKYGVLKNKYLLDSENQKRG